MIAVTIREWATLSKDGKKVRVQVRRIGSGQWTMTDVARRRACTRLGISNDDPNPGIVASHTIRAVDATGTHTFTFWS